MKSAKVIVSLALVFAIVVLGIVNFHRVSERNSAHSDFLPRMDVRNQAPLIGKLAEIGPVYATSSGKAAPTEQKKSFLFLPDDLATNFSDQLDQVDRAFQEALPNQVQQVGRSLATLTGVEPAPGGLAQLMREGEARFARCRSSGVCPNIRVNVLNRRGGYKIGDLWLKSNTYGEANTTMRDSGTRIPVDRIVLAWRWQDGSWHYKQCDHVEICAVDMQNDGDQKFICVAALAQVTRDFEGGKLTSGSVASVAGQKGNGSFEEAAAAGGGCENMSGLIWPS